jgi:pimeloyl-ACP methyl ester carboxylesterase
MVKGWRLIAGCAAATVALQAYNLSVRYRAPLGPGALEGQVLPWRWRGYETYAVERGSGPFVLLVHGIYAGSSSYEFRKIFAKLAEQNRVVAIDLLGCGRSERPNIDYSADTFVSQICDAVQTFGPRASAIVGSSLGGAYAIASAARLLGKLDGIVAICPTGLQNQLQKPAGAGGRATTAFFRSPVFGEAGFNALSARPSIGWFLRNQAYADPASATPEVIDHFSRVTHVPGSRYVPAHFVGGGLNCDISADLPQLSVPLLVLWGEQASFPSPVSSAPRYVDGVPRAKLTAFPNSKLLPHEEDAEAAAERIQAFLTQLPT